MSECRLGLLKRFQRERYIYIISITLLGGGGKYSNLKYFAVIFEVVSLDTGVYIYHQ